jgi:hypothetical protein
MKDATSHAALDDDAVSRLLEDERSRVGRLIVRQAHQYAQLKYEALKT